MSISIRIINYWSYSQIIKCLRIRSILQNDATATFTILVNGFCIYSKDIKILYILCLPHYENTGSDFRLIGQFCSTMMKRILRKIVHGGQLLITTRVYFLNIPFSSSGISAYINISLSKFGRSESETNCIAQRLTIW